MGILDPLYWLVTWVIVHIHAGLSTVLQPTSGAAWVLSIVLLTVFIRVLLFPLFVKQIQSSRKMQALQPKMKEMQRKHKNDKQRLNQEMMKLYQENGANPLGGCLPLLVQMPVFISLFQVLNHIALERSTDWGLTDAIVQSASNASFFGATIADRFMNSTIAPGSTTDAFLAVADTSMSARIVAIVLVLTSTVTMFLTMRHSMKRSAMQSSADNPAANMQKMLLFMAPVFGLFTLWLPIGVLIYIVTNNVWTLAQNYFIYWKYPAAEGAGAAASDDKASPASASPSSNGSGGALLAPRARTNAAANLPSPPPSKTVRQQPANRPKGKRRSGRKR